MRLFRCTCGQCGHFQLLCVDPFRSEESGEAEEGGTLTLTLRRLQTMSSVAYEERCEGEGCEGEGCEGGGEEDTLRWLARGDAVDSHKTVSSEELDEVALSLYTVPG